MPHTVAVFVDVPDAVLPNPSLPFLGRTWVFEDSIEPVDRAHLSRLFIHVHPLKQIGYPFLNGQFRILVGILLAVFIAVDPRVMINI